MVTAFRTVTSFGGEHACGYRHTCTPQIGSNYIYICVLNFAVHRVAFDFGQVWFCAVSFDVQYTRSTPHAGKNYKSPCDEELVVLTIVAAN